MTSRGSGVPGSGQAPGSERAQGLGFKGFRVWGLGFGVWGLGFGVWGLGFGAVGCRVEGLGPGESLGLSVQR